MSLLLFGITVGFHFLNPGGHKVILDLIWTWTSMMLAICEVPLPMFCSFFYQAVCLFLIGLQEALHMLLNICYCSNFFLSKAFGIHNFNDIPQGNPCESIRILCDLAQVSLFFISDVGVGASFRQYESAKALLRYWLCRVGQGLLKFLA